MTKSIIISSVLIFTQLLFSPEIYAEEAFIECEKSEKKSRCLDNIKNKLDRELQTWVNNHTFNLEEKALSTGGYAALKMFKRSQNGFVTFRNDNCRWQYLAISPDEGADIAYKKCYILNTQSRIKELSMVP